MKEVNPEWLQSSFEQQYGKTIQNIHTVKPPHVYLVDTENDQYVIKLFSSESLLRWQIRIVDQLKQKQTRGIVPFISNLSHSYLNQYTDHSLFYTVMPFIPGQPIQPDRRDHIVHSIRLLGYFHRQGSGIYGKKQVIPFRSKWYDKWNDRLEMIKRLEKKLTDQMGENDLAHFLQKNMPEAMKWAEWSLTHFPHSYMLFLEEQAQWERQIAHLDVAPHNFLVFETGYYYLIDYDLVDYAPPLFDVIQFLNRILNGFSWSFPMVRQLLEEYQHYYPLQPDQEMIIPILLVYPNDLFREWIGLWRNVANYHPKFVNQYLSSIDQQWENRRQFVQYCQSILT